MTAADVPLADLLVDVALEDRAAFRELYRRTAPKLYAVALRIVGEPARADDVVQEAYLRIWRTAASYDAQRGSPLAWAATLTRNLAIDRHRSDASRGRGRETTLEPDFAGSGDGASPETLAALRACLDRLDPEQRRLVLAAYLNGASREELSAESGRPVGTIKSWLHRSLGQLKACLDG